jgi:hypothetical protein
VCNQTEGLSLSVFISMFSVAAVADGKSAIPGSNPGGASLVYCGAIRCSLVQIGADHPIPLRSYDDGEIRHFSAVGATWCNL